VVNCAVKGGEELMKRMTIYKCRWIAWLMAISIAFFAVGVGSIKPAKAAKGVVQITVSSGSRANVRSAASLNSSIVGKAVRGQYFYVAGYRWSFLPHIL